MAENDENATNLPTVPPTHQAPHTLSIIKLHTLKKGEYNIWAMKMEHYLGHTYYLIWEVIQKGNGHAQVSTDPHGQIRVLPFKTSEEILARERERKERTTLLMAIPEDHLAKFHKITNAKEMWEAIKSRFGGNDESKKMFQSLLSQLEIHGAGVSTEDANQKFLRVFESDLKGLTASSSSIQNAAFVSSDNTNSTNEVAMISTRLKKFYKRIGRKLHFDAKEPVGFDKTKVECFNCHNTGHFAKECRSKGNQESRRRDAGNTGYKARDNGRRHARQDEHKAMVTIDGEGIDLTVHAKDNTKDYALMAFTSNNSGSDTEDKSRLGYENQIHEGDLSYENEVLVSVFDSRSSDVDDSPMNDRFAKVEGMHAVPPPMTGIYMPPKSNFGIDDSKFTYHPKQSKTSESNAKTSDIDSCESSSSVETLESMPKPVESKPKVVSEPKVWSDAPIIEEYESDSDDEYVFKASVE
nr:ribonuclease H-like domain-containing protein [Tanacetum cinerariifolium]